MAKRRTSGVQRRERATAEAMTRRLDEGRGVTLPDWRLLAIGGLLVVGVILIALVLLLNSGPNPNAGVQVPDDGTTHVTQGYNCRTPTTQAETGECGSDPYSSIPGTSGPHWGSPAGLDWGVYTEAAAETALIHNLEHGGIVIWYDSEAVTEDDISTLEQYVRSQTATGISGRFKFIVSPWGEDVPLPAPIVATAWHWYLELETANTDAIDAFANEHYGEAPEPNGGPAPPAG